LNHLHTVYDFGRVATVVMIIGVRAFNHFFIYFLFVKATIELCF
jgi:hypothetical protein